jgi:RNA ligase
MIHPARTLDFTSLTGIIGEACEDGLVNEMEFGGLHLYCYTRNAVYDRKWTPAALMCRGLILDYESKRVISTPFPKFFNVSEGDQTIPDLSFEIFEKLDGSMIQIFHHNGAWRTATKGSLRSEQAMWAADVMEASDLSALVRGTTYLAEAVGPSEQNCHSLRYPRLGASWCLR